MNRIDAVFDAAKRSARTVLIPYVTAGDPCLASTQTVVEALVAAGADIVELGVPFSDPMADGPVIQRAAERALAQGVGLRHVLGVVAKFRRGNAKTPIVLVNLSGRGVKDMATVAERAAGIEAQGRADAASPGSAR